MTEKQVQNLWLKESESFWKLDQDQVVSAKKVLERAEGKEVEVVSALEEEGMVAIGFALKEPLAKWGKKTAEIALDGTCE